MECALERYPPGRRRSTVGVEVDVLLTLWLACSEDDPPAPTDSADSGLPLPTGECAADVTDGLGDGPSFGAAHGELVFRSVPGYSTLQGSFQDGPPVGFHVEAERQGACRLLTFEASTCTPACAGGDLCVEGECLTPSRRLSGGTLTLSGPLELVAEPDGIDGYFVDSTQEPDHDAPLALAATAGADVPAFTAQTCPVVPVDPAADWSALLDARGPGEDVVLRWSNAQEGARVRLRMTTGIGTHGGISPVEVECEGPDTGALTLPGAYLDALYADGWACGECGGNDLVRYRSGAAGDRGAWFTSEAVTSFWYIPR